MARRRGLSQIANEMRHADMATRPVRDRMLKYTILTLLSIGVASPLFRHDTEALVVAAVCAPILLVLAVQAIWRRR